MHSATFSVTKLDRVQAQILHHVLARARGAAHTASDAWHLHFFSLMISQQQILH